MEGGSDTQRKLNSFLKGALGQREKTYQDGEVQYMNLKIEES
jgi:hypothetical protein